MARGDWFRALMLVLAGWVRRVADRLDRAARPAEPSPQQMVEAMRRYPGAPEHWLRAVAGRVDGAEGFEKPVEVETVTVPHASPSPSREGVGVGAVHESDLQIQTTAPTPTPPLKGRGFSVGARPKAKLALMGAKVRARAQVQTPPLTAKPRTNALSTIPVHKTKRPLARFLPTERSQRADLAVTTAAQAERRPGVSFTETKAPTRNRFVLRDEAMPPLPPVEPDTLDWSSPVRPAQPDVPDTAPRPPHRITAPPRRATDVPRFERADDAPRWPPLPESSDAIPVTPVSRGPDPAPEQRDGLWSA